MNTDFAHIATHTATATGAELTQCGVTAPLYELTELSREGERARMLYNLAELPSGELAHPVAYPGRRALEKGGAVVGWIA